MRRKPLFPPVDPRTGHYRRNKGRDGREVLTVNGRVRIRRRHYHSRQDGTTTPVDALLEATEATVSAGVREMCSRVGVEAKSFSRAAANMLHTAKHEGCAPLWERLLELRKNARGPIRRKAADG